METVNVDLEESPEALRRELSSTFREHRIQLPLLSESIQRVIAATSDEQVDARVLGDLIRRDQALTGHVLRVANSSLYAAPCTILSLQQAVSRLGMQQIREIALMVSAQTRLFSVKGHDHELRGEFQHAIATAMFAEEIARMRRLNVEQAFISGLLHDVGKPLLLQAIMDSDSLAAIAARRDGATLWAVIDDLHEMAGLALVTAWRLPPSLGETIAAHHDRETHSVGAQVVQLADDLAIHALDEVPGGDEALLRHPVAERLNLYPEDVSLLLALREHVAATAGALS